MFARVIGLGFSRGHSSARAVLDRLPCPRAARRKPCCKIVGFPGRVGDLEFDYSFGSIQWLLKKGNSFLEQAFHRSVLGLRECMAASHPALAFGPAPFSFLRGAIFQGMS